jgi:serine/threonine-protein kinase
VGSGTGYLYATQLLFPAAPEAELDFREVPNLLDLPMAEAETFVGERGLHVGAVDSIRHPEVPAGVILGQSPLPGQLAAPGGAVALTVSLGPERRIVPDVTRLRADRALNVLQYTGFQVAVDSVEAELPEGRIVATVPAAGAELALPSEVRLTVSLGPPLVPMPNLADMPLERARVILDSLGLAVGPVEERFRFGFNQGEILEQFPAADSLIPVGTEVRIVIGRRGFF